MKKRHILLFIYLLLSLCTYGQTPLQYEKDVQTIKAYDKIYSAPKHSILFVGSSSIRKWDNLQQRLGGLNVLNRGIGGAVINDLIYYLNDLVFKYEPRQIVLYIGENDLVAEPANADTLFNRTLSLYKAIRMKMPNVPIVYISIKPSPSRDKYAAKAMQANKLIQKFLSKEPHVAFVDIFPLMLKNGHSRPELFLDDMLHMNQKGYKIWEDAIRPHLLPL